MNLNRGMLLRQLPALQGSMGLMLIVGSLLLHDVKEL